MIRMMGALLGGPEDPQIGRSGVEIIQYVRKQLRKPVFDETAVFDAFGDFGHFGHLAHFGGFQGVVTRP
jgi:hypothetical protein